MRNSIQKIIRYAAAILVGLAVTASGVLYAADELEESPELLPVEDLHPDELAEIDVSLLYTIEGFAEPIPIPNVKLELYQVANLEVENGAAHYSLTESFADSGILFEGMTADYSYGASKTFDEMIKNSAETDDPIMPVATGQSDTDGVIIFSGLTPGMYLCRQTEAVQIIKENNVAVTMEPVLWMAPMYKLNAEGDGYIWDYVLAVQPKEGGLYPEHGFVTETPGRDTSVTPSTAPPTATPTITPGGGSEPPVTRLASTTPTPTKSITYRSTTNPPNSSSTSTSTTTHTTNVRTGDESPIGLFVLTGVVAVVVIVVVLMKRKKMN